MKQTLPQWLQRLEALQPDRIELGLGRVRKVLDVLNLDLSSSTIITVAGTNGKGSMVAYLEALYQQLGISTLAYTSPHILKYNERIRINGQSVDDDALVEAFEQIEQARTNVGASDVGIALTYFEFGTLAAIVLMARHQPDIAIMEVGLGGRLDAVNVLDADVAVITSIGIDHTDWLGPDRESIGREKAGIMRPGKPVISGDPEPPECIAQIGQQLGATLYQYTEDYQLESVQGSVQFSSVWAWQSAIAITGLERLAQHQRINAATALAALCAQMDSDNADEHVEHVEPRRLSDVIKKGQWLVSVPGRMQKIDQQPEVWLDVAHNPHAAAALAMSLEQQLINGRTLAVLAMLADKDITGVAAALDHVIDHWYLAPSAGPRGLDVEQLQHLIEKGAQAPTTTLQSVPQALQQARNDAQPNDRIIVLGSFTNATTLLKAMSEQST